MEMKKKVLPLHYGLIVDIEKGLKLLGKEIEKNKDEAWSKVLRELIYRINCILEFANNSEFGVYFDLVAYEKELK